MCDKVCNLVLPFDVDILKISSTVRAHSHKISPCFTVKIKKCFFLICYIHSLTCSSYHEKNIAFCDSCNYLSLPCNIFPGCLLRISVTLFLYVIRRTGSIAADFDNRDYTFVCRNCYHYIYDPFHSWERYDKKALILMGVKKRRIFIT